MQRFLILVVCLVLPVAVVAAVRPVNLTQADINAFLHAHNKARTILGVKNLDWNSTLSTSAGNYGSRCVFAHSKNNGAYGENLYASYPRNNNHTLLATVAVNKWVDEKSVADPPHWKCMTSARTCGHYTQVIWRNTHSVGCAIVHCTISLSNYVICQYYPPGNYIGQTPY